MCCACTGSRTVLCVVSLSGARSEMSSRGLQTGEVGCDTLASDAPDEPASTSSSSPSSFTRPRRNVAHAHKNAVKMKVLAPGRFHELFRKYLHKFRDKACYIDPEMPASWARAARRAVYAYGARLQPYFDAALYCVITHRAPGDCSPTLERARRWRIHLLHCTDGRVQRWIRVGEYAAEWALAGLRASADVHCIGTADGKENTPAPVASRWRRRGVSSVPAVKPDILKLPRASGPEACLAPSNDPHRSRCTGTPLQWPSQHALVCTEVLTLTPTASNALSISGVERIAEAGASAITPIATAASVLRSARETSTCLEQGGAAMSAEEPMHSGYCELCSTRFQHYAVHLKSSEHSRRSRRIDWRPLDALAMAIYTERLRERSSLARAIAASVPVSPISSRDSSVISDMSSSLGDASFIAKQQAGGKGSESPTGPLLYAAAASEDSVRNRLLVG